MPSISYVSVVQDAASSASHAVFQQLVAREDIPESADTDPTDVFTFGTRLGIVFIAQCAFLSLIAVVSLLFYIAYCALMRRRNPRRKWDASTPLHLYFLSLLIAESIQATGTIMNLKWVIEADVVDGHYCTVQGVLKQIGDISVALSTLAIAIHTFCAIVVRWVPRRPRLSATLVLLGIWFTITLIIGVSAAFLWRKDYWGDTTFWCWIRPTYPVQQILLDYVFMWATAFVNIILYVPLALVIKGKISMTGFKVHLQGPQEKKDSRQSMVQVGRGVDGIAMQMLFYPLIYTLTVLPIAIVRFRAFHDKSVPFLATVIADCLFSLSGLFNVILFSITRPALLPHRDSSATSNKHALSFSIRSRGHTATACTASTTTDFRMSTHCAPETDTDEDEDEASFHCNGAHTEPDCASPRAMTPAITPAITPPALSPPGTRPASVHLGALPDNSELNLNGDWLIPGIRASAIGSEYEDSMPPMTFAPPPKPPAATTPPPSRRSPATASSPAMSSKSI